MIDSLGAGGAAALVGLFGGILLGLSARIGRFCTLGAIEDTLYANDDTRLRMWFLAIGVAVLGTFGLSASGMFNAVDSIYLASRWNPIPTVLGGLMFGYGMALTGTCGFGALARLSGGDMRAFVVVLVLGVSSYMTLSGPIAYVRVWLFPVETAQSAPGFAHAIERLVGMSTNTAGLVIGLLIIATVLATSNLRNKPASMFWAVIVGLAIISGWAGTQWVANESFGEVGVASHTFSAPPGETILWLMTASGSSISFGIGSVAGVLVGGFVGSLFKGHFRWEGCEDPRELRRQIIGAALMGIGAVLALGCTVGQGMSAFSVLAFSAPVAFVSIFSGAALGLRQLITGWQPAI